MTFTANCAHCGRIVDTREEADGGDKFGCQLTDGRWSCSADCYDRLTGESEEALIATEEALVRNLLASRGLDLVKIRNNILNNGKRPVRCLAEALLEMKGLKR